MAAPAERQPRNGQQQQPAKNSNGQRATIMKNQRVQFNSHLVFTKMAREKTGLAWELGI